MTHQQKLEAVLQCGSTNTEESGEYLFRGGCGKLVPFSFVYRCGECTAFFHRHCLYEHFKHESDKNKGPSMKKVLQTSRKRAEKDIYPDVE